MIETIRRTLRMIFRRPGRRPRARTEGWFVVDDSRQLFRLEFGGYGDNFLYEEYRVTPLAGTIAQWFDATRRSAHGQPPWQLVGIDTGLIVPFTELMVVSHTPQRTSIKFIGPRTDGAAAMGATAGSA